MQLLSDKMKLSVLRGWSDSPALRRSQPFGGGGLTRSFGKVNLDRTTGVSPIEVYRIKSMTRTILALLLALVTLPSCQTAHNAAVSTFRVVDAPNAYLRRKLGVDQEQPAASPPAPAPTGYSASAPIPPQQPYPVQQPAPPVQPQGQVAAVEREPEPPGAGPTAAPQVSNARTTVSKPPATPQTASTQTSDLPYGKPVPGKPGYVFSPYDKNGGYVDVTGFAPGQKVKDPYSGKIFLVP
jgi:hypothetical protein